jgi:phytoene dehydrogenase-like protein
MTSSEAKRWDAIVIGGGHNGLACAAALGRTGRKVLVLEAASTFGGGAATQEFAPGFRVSGLAHVVNRLHPEMVAALALDKHGLELGAPDMPSVALSMKGEPLILAGAYGERLEGRVGEADRAGWRALRALLLRQAGVLKPFLARRPPDLGMMSLEQATALGSVALKLRRLGKEDMREFMRMVLMNVADVLDEHVADDRLKGLVAFDATLGAHLGPRSPTSLLGLYYRLAGETAGVAAAQALPKGGMGAVAAALARAAEAAGCTLRPSAVVGRILVEERRACGVVMEDGSELQARTIVSAINPVTTFLELVGPRCVDTGFVRRLGHIRMKGDAAKLHLALDAPPRFAGLSDDAHRGRLVIAPSVDHVENAFNPAKYGAYSPEPVMEITLPSLSDSSLAPAGACVLSAVVQFAPYALKQGWEAGKPGFLAAIMAVLERHAPGIGRSVRHAELLTPADIETCFRMPGGHWHHGELQVDQMLMNRPAHGADGYDTPVDGLYLAGAGSHPGGGVSGAPGWNAAKRVVEMRG